MEAEINEHPLGFELRVYVQGAFLYLLVLPTRELAEQEAYDVKREGSANGWTDRPLFSGAGRQCGSDRR